MIEGGIADGRQGSLAPLCDVVDWLISELDARRLIMPPEGALRLVASHLLLLYRWNRTVNLTGIRSIKEGLRRHAVEALEALPYLRGYVQDPEALLVDLGSGNGFPAMPLLHSITALRGHLVESSLRKVDFLEAVIRQTGLDDRVRAEHKRIRSPRDLPVQATVVSMRAFPDPFDWTRRILEQLSVRAVLAWLSIDDAAQLGRDLRSEGHQADLHRLASHETGALLVARP